MLNQPANPDLPGAPSYDPITAPAAPGAMPRVPALAALTAPMPNTKVKQKAYFVCTLKTAAMHRYDGKKLPFINGVLGTDIQQDIDYLRYECENGNQYIREANPEEVQDIENLLNPRAALLTSVKKEVEAELRETIEAEIRAKLALEMSVGNTDGARIAGIDGGGQVLKAADAPTMVRLNPVSSTDIATAAVGGRTPINAAAAATAALVAARATATAPAK
jgi:hypothetical protein